MSNEWINHSQKYSNKNNITFKESLQSHENASLYYNEKAINNDDWKTKYQQEICSDIYSLNAVNQLSKDDTNSKKLKQKRDNLKKSF
jgi:hypothetical protein